MTDATARDVRASGALECAQLLRVGGRVGLDPAAESVVVGDEAVAPLLGLVQQGRVLRRAAVLFVQRDVGPNAGMTVSAILLTAGGTAFAVNDTFVIVTTARTYADVDGGAFTGLERLGGADWYRVGVASLRARQAADGRWPGGTAFRSRSTAGSTWTKRRSSRPRASPS